MRAVLFDVHCQAAATARAILGFPPYLPDEENISVTRTTSASRSRCSSFRSRSPSRSPHNDGGALNLDTKATKVTTATTDDEEVTLEKVSPTSIEPTELRSRLEEAFHSSVAADHHGPGGNGSHRRCRKYSSTEDIQAPPAHTEPEENGYENGLEAHQHPDLHSRSRAKHKDDSAVDYYNAFAAASAAKEKPLSLVPKSIAPLTPFKGSLHLPTLDPINFPFPLSLPRPPADLTASIYPRPELLHYFHQLQVPYPPFAGFSAYPPPRIYSQEEPSSYRKELAKEPRPPSPSRTSPAKVIPLYHPSRVESSHPHQSSTAAAVASIH